MSPFEENKGMLARMVRVLIRAVGRALKKRRGRAPQTGTGLCAAAASRNYG